MVTVSVVAVAEVRELAANARCKDGARAKGLAQRAHAAAPESACAIEARVCQQEFDIICRGLSRAVAGGRYVESSERVYDPGPRSETGLGYWMRGGPAWKALA